MPDYEEALEHFRCAHALDPHPAVRFNIAVCYDRLSRFREAIEEYALAAESTAIDDAARARAREQVSELRARLGRIRFRGFADGAEVRIDGVRRCAVPCEIEEDPGSHVVVVRAGGAETIETVEVTRRGVRFVARRGRAPPQFEPDDSGIDLGWLTWTGAGLAAIGTGLAIGFGTYTVDLHGEHAIAPSRELADEGTSMRDLTNVFLAVALSGALLFVIDLAVQTGE